MTTDTCALIIGVLVGMFGSIPITLLTIYCLVRLLQARGYRLRKVVG